jgi:hypothetical protein
MEDLKIDIKILTEKRNEKQCEIADLFNCRFPNNEEFRSIKPMVVDIIVLEARIECMKTAVDTITANATNAVWGVTILYFI